MIQFFIENQEVILPDDFSFTQIDENPLITNNGEFTLDITVSLRNGKNAKAAKFINRINKIDIDASYNGLMIDDGKSKHGTIIIQSHTNTDLTFQFVSGNSELNYLAGNDKKIWELNWGSESPIDYNIALRSINNPCYGEKRNTPVPPFYFPTTSWMQNFVCAPVLIGGEIYNNYLLNEKTTVTPNSIIGIERVIMQPYLLYYLNKLPSLLGFTAGENVLNTDERVLITYLLNAVDSLDYSDALPDMTINEFIDAIETTYNVWFVIDSVTNTMSIVRTKNQLENKKIVRLSNVLDEYTREIDVQKKSFRFGYSKVEYELSETLYFKYNALQDDILKKCTIIDFVNKSAISSYILDHDTPDQFIIYRDTSTDEDFFYGRPVSQDFCSIKIAEEKYITLINKFKGVGDSTDNLFSLKVVPAAMQGDYRDVMWYSVSGQEKHSKFQYQLPVSSNTFQNIITADGFMKSVEDGIKTTQRLSVIEVALFSGILQTPTYLWWAGVPVPGRLNIQYPFSHTDYWPDFWVMDNISDRFDRFVDWYNTYYSPFVKTTMRLSGEKGLVENYKLENLVDFGMKYEFQIPDAKNLLAENLFEFKNQKYMPISFERIKSRKKGLVKGTFYRML